MHIIKSLQFSSNLDSLLLKVPFSDKYEEEELVCNMDTEDVNDMLFGMLGTEKEIGELSNTNLSVQYSLFHQNLLFPKTLIQGSCHLRLKSRALC